MSHPTLTILIRIFFIALAVGVAARGLNLLKRRHNTGHKFLFTTTFVGMWIAVFFLNAVPLFADA